MRNRSEAELGEVKRANDGSSAYESSSGEGILSVWRKMIRDPRIWGGVNEERQKGVQESAASGYPASGIRQSDSSTDGILIDSSCAGRMETIGARR